MLPSNLKHIGKLDEYFKKVKAGIIKLNSSKISIGDSVWARKGDDWIKTVIISLRLNDIDVVRNKIAKFARHKRVAGYSECKDKRDNR